MRKEICHEQGDDLLLDGKAFRAAGAVVGFQNLKHILLIVRPGHCLTAAINRHRAGALELPNQANGVVFMVVQSNELGHALQHFGAERIDIALPCFCQYTERISVNALTVFPILGKCCSDAGDFPLCVALSKTQTKACTVGGVQESNGFRVAAANLGAHFCACGQRRRDTGLLCKQQGFLLLRQSRINLADDVQIAVVVQQLAGGDGVLTIENIVVTIPVTDFRSIGDAFVKLSSNPFDAVCVEIPLVVAARNFQKFAVDDHFVMNKFNHRQIDDLKAQLKTKKVELKAATKDLAKAEAKKAAAEAKAAEEAKKGEAEDVLKKLLASGMTAEEILAKLQ